MLAFRGRRLAGALQGRFAVLVVEEVVGTRQR